MRTRTRIDWRWENGQVQADYRDLLVAGSSHISRVLLQRIQPFGLDALVTYNPDYPGRMAGPGLRYPAGDRLG